jgi:hypothetical protein
VACAQGMVPARLGTHEQCGGVGATYPVRDHGFPVAANPRNDSDRSVSYLPMVLKRAHIISARPSSAWHLHQAPFSGTGRRTLK